MKPDWKALSIIPVILVLLAGLLSWEFRSRKPEPVPALDIPDFTGIADVKKKKDTFFRFMLPMVRAANDQVWQERQRLLSISRILYAGRIPGDDDSEFLQQMTVKYRLDEDPAGSPQAMIELMKRVDVLPASLVLAQSANESAWGTARFARRGNNYFGLWCWSQSCGLVPRARDEGATHEVASFEAPQGSVDYYVMTLNSHPAYGILREIRARQRQQNAPLRGQDLAQGLINYSERREAYVKEIRAMIRHNNLIQFTRQLQDS